MTYALQYQAYLVFGTKYLDLWLNFQQTNPSTIYQVRDTVKFDCAKIGAGSPAQDQHDVTN